MATIVNVSGSGDVNYCYAKINGTNYIGEVSNITLTSNTIVFEVFGAGGNPGTVTIDGDTVLTYELGNATYSWAVPSNVTEINIVLTDKNFYTTITVTTKKSVDSGGEHYTNISGTAREIESGTVLIGGVLREIESGLVLVNGVAREIAFGSAKAKVSQLSVGDIVRVPVNGIQKEFIVVHQGIPSSLYDSSCDGTWLLIKDCIGEENTWATYPGGKLDYSQSLAHQYAAKTFMGMLDAGLKNLIKTAKIPYYGSTNSVLSGSNGLSTQAFMLSVVELGFKRNQYIPEDGAVLSYFNGAADSTRIAYKNGVAVSWHTRTPYPRYSSAYALYVKTSGGYDYNLGANYNMRPAFILDPETQYDPNTMEILY